MGDSSGVFAVAFIGLLGTPIAAPSFAWGVTKLPNKSQSWVYSTLVVFTAFICTISALNISASSPRLNAIAFISTLWATLVLLLSAYRLRSKLLRHAIGSIAILLLGICLFMGTLGGLATAFIVGDMVPIYSMNTHSERACHVTSYGNATTESGGYTVTITQRLAFAPFLEQALMRKQYENPSQKPEELCKANT